MNVLFTGNLNNGKLTGHLRLGSTSVPVTFERRS
jgi:hypothetical protein